MVIMASGVVRGCVRMTTMMTAAELCKMVVIFQLIGCQKHAALVYSILMFNIAHPCYHQLAPAKTRYPLTSIT